MREEGFYWVKRFVGFLTPKMDSWEVARWDGERWWRTGYEDFYHDTDIAVEGPKLTPPSE